MNPTRLNGRKVVGTEGYILGEVEGVNIDLSTWQANAFYVNLSDETTAELGFKRPFLSKVVVIIPSKTVGLIGNFITLDETVEKPRITRRMYKILPKANLELAFAPILLPHFISNIPRGIN